MKRKTILVTGAAGFIGFHLCKKLLDLGMHVIGIDNINDYYDVNLKYDRLKELGIGIESKQDHVVCESSIYGDKMKFVRISIDDRKMLPPLFKDFKFDLVCNLAAQAGVRYSIENPKAYIDSNINGFSNILECCRNFNIKRLVYASSSSVYGNSDNVPFKESHNVDHPISLYAATKKSNELMAYTYSHLFNIETVGLRFFTVYGPWGRPDMAMFLFTDAILNNKPIKVFNKGNLSRDFTYISDIIEGVISVISSDICAKSKYRLFNIGNSNPIRLLDFIKEIEIQTNKKAIKEMLPMQEGDVNQTYADISALLKECNYKPSTPIKKGVEKFVNWYKLYYKP